MIVQSSLDQLLNAVSIEDVVGDYVSLKRSGSRYKGCCPFHDEKTPSFVVTPTIGIYKCFGCQKGGNAIQFLMDVENLSFVEAARNLAKRYSVDLMETTSENQDVYQEQQRQKESLQAAVDYAQQFFVDQLFDTDEGKSIGLPYFKERGFTVDTIKKWGLGYSPESWEALASAAHKKGYNPEVMVKAGLLKLRDNGTHYDLFRYRVMFSIHAVTGKVIGFAGRKMSSTDPSPKYVNSPETDLYKKSDVLFGLYQAKNAMKKLDKVYMTEGYTDVITLHQSGIENVVASSGTALTPGQIKLLKRFTNNVTVVYDGDMAGIKASIRGIDLLLQEGLNVRVVPLPEGQDPDSYCQALGGDAFQDYLNGHEETFIFFKAKLLISDTQNDPLRKSDAVREILKSVALITDPLKRSALSQQLASICDIDQATLLQELSVLLKNQQAKERQDFVKEVSAAIDASGVAFNPDGEVHEMVRLNLLNHRDQELALFRLLLLYGEEKLSDDTTIFDFVWGELQSDANLSLDDDLAKKLSLEVETHGSWPGTQHFIHHLDSEIAAWAAGVLADGHTLSPAFAENYIDVTQESEVPQDQVLNMFLHLRRKKVDALIENHLSMMKEPENTEEDLSMMMEFLIELNEVKRQIAEKLGNSVSRI
ncbi:MAG: DNA primase [Bacteroidia bacterium]|nr:DNA primase [Bacteroidia bacterium]